MRAPQDFIALTAIPGPNGVRAYNAGDDVPASAVANLNLVVGQDVRPSSPDVLPRPAGNAARANWDAYWRAQGLSGDELDGMTRDEMAAKEPLVAEQEPIVPSPSVLPGEPVGGVVRFVQPDNVARQAAEQGAGPLTEGAPDRPSDSAVKADWVDYAVGRGMPRDAAEEATKKDLQEYDFDGTFGPQAS